MTIVSHQPTWALAAMLCLMLATDTDAKPGISFGTNGGGRISIGSGSNFNRGGSSSLSRTRTPTSRSRNTFSTSSRGGSGIGSSFGNTGHGIDSSFGQGIDTSFGSGIDTSFGNHGNGIDTSFGSGIDTSFGNHGSSRIDTSFGRGHGIDTSDTSFGRNFGKTPSTRNSKHPTTSNPLSSLANGMKFNNGIVSIKTNGEQDPDVKFNNGLIDFDSKRLDKNNPGSTGLKMGGGMDMMGGLLGGNMDGIMRNNQGLNMNKNKNKKDKKSKKDKKKKKGKKDKKKKSKKDKKNKKNKKHKKLSKKIKKKLKKGGKKFKKGMKKGAKAIGSGLDLGWGMGTGSYRIGGIGNRDDDDDDDISISFGNNNAQRMVSTEDRQKLLDSYLKDWGHAMTVGGKAWDKLDKYPSMIHMLSPSR